MKEISDKQIGARLCSENPWWEKDHGIPKVYQSYRPRAYLDLFNPLLDSAAKHRAIVLLGPRRVGKTVLIHHAISDLLEKGVPPSNILYCSIDNPIYNGLSLDSLLGFYAKLKDIDLQIDHVYVFFDEIQYLKDWERYLKGLVDLKSNLKLTVSGSAAAALKLKSQESGAGRFTDFLLPPLTFYEYLLLLDKCHLAEKQGEDEFYVTNDIDELNRCFIDYLNFGGYPEIALTPELQQDPSRYIKNDIIDKVLLRDLPSLYGIQDIQELNYLFTTLAFNTANEVSLESLSKSSGVAKNTIKRYIEYLEAAFLIKIIHRVDRSGKRFKRANFFKVYLTNPSIRAALFSPAQLDDEAIGDLVETAIFSQWFHSDITTLYYARWNGGEVDIVQTSPSKSSWWAVESKWSDRYYDKPGELKSLLQYCHSNNLNTAAVTTITKTGSALIQNVTLDFKPASIYAYTVGANLVTGKMDMAKEISLQEKMLNDTELA